MRKSKSCSLYLNEGQFWREFLGSFELSLDPHLVALNEGRQISIFHFHSTQPHSSIRAGIIFSFDSCETEVARSSWNYLTWKEGKITWLPGLKFQIFSSETFYGLINSFCSIRKDSPLKISEKILLFSRGRNLCFLKISIEKSAEKSARSRGFQTLKKSLFADKYWIRPSSKVD